MRQRFRSRHLGSSSFGFFAILVALWSLLSWNLNPQTVLPWMPFTIWAIFVSLFTLLIVSLFEQARPGHFFPRESDAWILVFAVPVPAFVVKYLFVLFFEIEILKYRQILFVSGIVMASLVIYEQLRTSFSREKARKYKLWLRMNEKEKAELRSMVKDEGGHHFDYLNDDRWKDADLILISRGVVHRFKDHPDLMRAYLRGIPVADWRTFLNHIHRRIHIEHLDFWTFLVEADEFTALKRAYLSFRYRYFEPLMAAVLLLILSPLFLLLALAVFSTSRGGVLYRQKRTGHRALPFTLYKFRTMVSGSESGGIQWAQKNDSRVTALGKVLRASHLDELPQLWNVLVGDLSFIGPRPERPEFYAKLEDSVPLFWLRTLARPGITGWAQVWAGYAASEAESLTKLEYDLYYIQNISLRLDLIVTLRTITKMVLGFVGRQLVE